jgi:hypothetical protein
LNLALRCFGRWLEREASYSSTTFYVASGLLWRDSEELGGGFSHSNLVLNFFKSSSGTRALPPPFFDNEDDYRDDPPKVKEEILLLKLSFVCQTSYICKFFVSKNVYFSSSKEIVWNNSPHFNVAFMGRALDYVVSAKVAGLGTT